MSATTTDAASPLVGQPAEERNRLLEIRQQHASAPGLRERLSYAYPDRARQAYLDEQLSLTERLTAAMAMASDLGQLAGEVVGELQVTFGIYLAVIMRLDGDGVPRPVASAGPLAEQGGRFLLAEQPLTASSPSQRDPDRRPHPLRLRHDNAMITNRPYRAAMTPEAALQELRRCCNTQFDPRVVEALERVLDADGAALAVSS